MVNKKGKYYYPVFQIGVACSKELQERVKRFCSLQGVAISKFTATALENEVNFQVDSMPEEERKAIESILSTCNKP